jgi:hypothetical protein
MKTLMLIMEPEASHEVREVELPIHPSYETLRDLLTPIIGCKHIEHVTVLADTTFKGTLDFKRADMFVDEDGHEKKRPLNGAATAIYRRNAIINQGAKAEDLSWIAGPAVLFNRIVWT